MEDDEEEEEITDDDDDDGGGVRKPPGCWAKNKDEERENITQEKHLLLWHTYLRKDFHHLSISCW